MRNLINQSPFPTSNDTRPVAYIKENELDTYFFNQREKLKSMINDMNDGQLKNFLAMQNKCIENIELLSENQKNSS